MRQHIPKRSRWWRAAALTSTFALVAAACGDDSDDEDTSTDEGDDTEETEDGEDAAAEANCPEGDGVNIGWIAWDEDIAVTHLWDALLTEQGYEVEQTQLDVGPIYSGLANGDVDLFLDAWLPDTHATYWEENGENIEQLGVWNEEATLHLTVPEYVDVESIDELADNADEFESTIIGIEPDAGLMERTREDVQPTYGLEDWELTESGTPAMLAELDAAIANEEPIVVTLWRPHWAYASYDLRDLEDPEGTLGEGENLEALGCVGFSDKHPEVAEWISNFSLDSEQLNELTNLVIEEHGSGEEEAAIEEWLSDEDNRALADSWIEGGDAAAEGDDMDDAEADDAEADDMDDAEADDAEADDMDDAEADDAEADDMDDAEGDDMEGEETDEG